MPWQFIILDRLLGQHELIAAFSQVFHIQEHEVLIVKGDSVAEVKDPLLEGVLVVCETYLLKNVPFFLRIEISLWESSLVPEDRLSLFSELCQILGCQLITEDLTTLETSYSDESFLLVDGSGHIQPVRVSESENYYFVEPIELKD